MKRKFLILLALLTLACWGVPAAANTFTFETLPGATENGGNPVDAKATITTGAGTVDITLQNLLANPLTIAQCLSDFSFVLSNFTGPLGGGSLTSSSGQEITVNGDGTFLPGSVVATGWLLSKTGSSTFLLNDLGGAGPAHLIIGPPDGTYSNANDSIAGNGPHNPLLNQTATFALSIPGVTASTHVDEVTFSFGTEAGNNVNVPIPPTALLLGSGLLGLVGLGWRHSKS